MAETTKSHRTLAGIADEQLAGQQALESASELLGETTSRLEPVQRFNLALMNLIKRAQGMGTGAFQRRGFELEERQAERVLKQAEPGFTPTQQAAIRGAEAGALRPSILGAERGAQTFAEQLRGFGTAMDRAQAIGTMLYNVEQQKYEKEQQEKKQWFDVLSEISTDEWNAMDDKTQSMFSKHLGISKDIIGMITQEKEPTKYTPPEAYKLWELSGGQVGTGMDFNTWYQQIYREGGETKSLTSTEIKQYQTDYPDAGITMGDTKADADEKIYLVYELSEEIQNLKNQGKTKEEVEQLWKEVNETDIIPTEIQAMIDKAFEKPLWEKILEWGGKRTTTTTTPSTIPSTQKEPWKEWTKFFSE